MLNFISKGPSICRIFSHQIRQISIKTLGIRLCMPSDFSRRPRSLDELAYWKATEFRQLILYLCPIVLKGIVSQEIYLHFLTLHVALTILLNENAEKRNKLLDYSRALLSWFISSSPKVFGETFVTYNVHSLLHLPDDV